MLLIAIMNTFKTFRLNNIGKRFVINKNDISNNKNVYVIYDVSEGTEATNDPDLFSLGKSIKSKFGWCDLCDLGYKQDMSFIGSCNICGKQNILIFE